MDRLRRISRGHIFGKTFRLTYSPNVRCRGGARPRSMTETGAQSGNHFRCKRLVTIKGP